MVLTAEVYKEKSMSEVSTPQVAPQAPVVGDAGKVENAQVPANVDAKKVEGEELYEVKVNGKVKKMTLAELKKHAALSHSSTEKFTEAKRLKEEVEKLKSQYDSEDDIARWKRQGKTASEIRDLLADKLTAILEEEQLDPKERELRDLRAREAERKKQEEAAEQEKMSAEEKRKTEIAARQLEHEIVEAAESLKIPVNPFMLKQLAYEMYNAGERGVDLSAKDAARIVEKQWFDTFSEVLPKMNTRQIKELLGADMLKALQEEAVAEVKTANAPFVKKQNQEKQQVPKKQESPEEQKTYSEFFRGLRRGNR